ncbi:hypothetical protein DFH06DRAFT_1326478 [Mycena polygramma]|nr:hypothetical protein DFH06DRAFT_1326478 [Mycena polygramma]
MPPPPYTEDAPPYDADAAELGDLFSTLSLAPVTTTPPRPPRLYLFETPIARGLTPSWAEAADQTQGVAGGSARRLTPKSKKHKPKSGGYAVFFGRVPGAYHLWYEEAEPLINGVSGSLYQGYPNYDLATAAYEYARDQGWTRVMTSSEPVLLDSTVLAPIPRLPTPAQPTDAINPLHAVRNGRWYVVYCGIVPGVYQSSLECSLNTVGLRCATHDSFATEELAVRAFREASAAVQVMYDLSHLQFKKFARYNDSEAKHSHMNPTLNGPRRHSVHAAGLTLLSSIPNVVDASAEASSALFSLPSRSVTKRRHWHALPTVPPLLSMSQSPAGDPVDPAHLVQISEVIRMKKEEHRMRSRINMARFRMRLKTRPPHEQEIFKVRARHARARYRASRRLAENSEQASA